MSRPRTDSPSPWLGGRPFRIAVVLAVLMLTAGVLIKRASIRSMQDTVVPAVTLLGAERFEVGRPELYRVLVFNAVDGAPLPNADVRLLCVRETLDEATDEWQSVVRRVAGGQTDLAGQSTFEVVLPAACGPLASGQSGEVTIFAEVDVLGTKHGASVPLTSQSGGAATALLVTDKPIYQPGQVVRVRALLFGQDRRPLSNGKVTLEISDPKNNKVFKRELTTSPFGNVHADFPLADQVNLGAYSISVGTGRVGARQTIEVKRYSLPRFEVQLEPAAKVVEPGKPLRVTVRATWMFGEPVVGAALHVWTAPRGDTGYPAKLEAKTDASGEFTTEVPAPAEVGDFEVRAKVAAEGGEAITATVPIVVSKHPFSVELVPDGGPLVAGIPNGAFLLASSPDGAPARVRVSVEPGGPTVDTTAFGIARISFVPSDGQQLHARRLDGSGGAEVFSLPDLASSAGVLVRTERARYASNEVIRVVVKTALQDSGTVYLDATKGPRVLAVGTCGLEGGACATSLKLPSDVSGLVRIRALRMNGQDKALASRFVLVGARENLSIGVRTDKPSYAPAETATLDFDVTRRDGQPVSAALSLAGVDEAVFALAESRPDLQVFFLGIGKDLYAEGSVGRSGGRYGRYRSKGLLAPKSALLRDRSEELLSLDRAAADESQEAMLAALAAAAPVPAALDFDLPKKVRLGKLIWLDAEEPLWAMVVFAPGPLFLAVAGVLIAYGLRRLRRGKIDKVLTDEDVAAWRKASRGLLTAWLLAFTVPFLSVIAVILVSSGIFRIHGEALETMIMGDLGVVVLGFAALQIRALMRVRQTKVGLALPGLFQVGWLMPAAGILFYAAVFVPSFVDRVYFRYYLENDAKVAAALVVVILAAQLVFGLLSVIRNTAAQDTTMRRRVWLLLSRATFVGLPVSLVVLGGALYQFEDRGYEQYGRSSFEFESDFAASREGGTGTRAKGEEGSMGMLSPSAQDAQVGPPMARVRTQFPETLLWVPEVVTDARGHARVPVPLADSITTWRLSASAISAEGGMGTTTTAIRVKQDFFGEFTLPAVLTQKDEIAVPVTVFNYLEESQKVRVTLEHDVGLSVIGGAERQATLGPNEVQTVAFRVRADQPGTHRVRVRLAGSALSDALEREVRVEPDGYRVEQILNGILPATPSRTVQLPKGAVKGGSEFYVKVYGGMISQLVESLDGSFRRPYGCFEQTSSATYPNVLLLDFLRRVKRSSPAAETKANDYIGTGYQRLLSYEVDGGGFSLYGGSPANPILSAYGLMEFHDMARVYGVDPEVMKRTRDWLYGQQRPNGSWAAPISAIKLRTREPEWIRTTSYIAWAIAMTGDHDPRLQRALDLVGSGDAPEADEPYTVALRANALAEGGRSERAKTLLQSLVDKGVRDASGLHWSTKEEGITFSRGSSMAVELTALIVQAMARIDGWPVERAAASAWIANQRGPYGMWYSTRSTVAAMRALLAGVKPPQPGDQRVDVLVNGKPAGRVEIPEKERDVFRQLNLGAYLEEGDNVVELRSEGEDLTYQVVAVHYLPWAKAPGVMEDAPIALEVRYGTRTVKVGQTVSCEAQLRWSRDTPVQLPMLELGVPPGFAAESDDFEKLVREGMISRYSLSAGKVLVYLDRLTREKELKLAYRLRAVIPVRAATPVSVAYPYYEPEVRATVQPVVLTSR